MLNKLSIRWRLTALSVLLLALCCVGLTLVLNVSANTMAQVLQTAVATIPAQEEKGAKQESLPALPLGPTMPSIEEQTAQTVFRKESVLYMLLVLVGGGGLTYYLSGRALMPLQNLSEQMQNRTAHNLSQRLPTPQSGDEIAALTNSFNTMSEKLEQAFAMQKRFSQSAAHELRTPLTVLKTKVEVFQKKESHTPEEYEKLLAVIGTHTNRLSQLVKSLLELTNMDALDCNEEIFLPEMLQGVARELSSCAKERDVSIVLVLPKTAAPFYGNASLLHRAFYNVVENALHYNVEHGKVTLHLKEESEKTVVQVVDTGIGISPDAQANIFEAFYRVDKSRSRQMGGAGLGLSTAKAIVENHGGTIAVRENPEGGAVFEFIFQHRG